MKTKNEAKLRAFGQTLFEMREGAYITQEKLAEELDVNSKLISRYETGEAQMGALLYDRWLIYFGQKTNEPQIKELLRLFTTLSENDKEQLIEYAKWLNAKTSK